MNGRNACRCRIVVQLGERSPLFANESIPEQYPPTQLLQPAPDSRFPPFLLRIRLKYIWKAED